MAKEVKCRWCSELAPKGDMFVEEKSTGKLNKNGSKKIDRKYYHFKCREEFEKDKLRVQYELEKWDEVYQYIRKLHNLDVLDKRMIERLQDLRNGTVKVNNKKVKRYKSGVEYTKILSTYVYLEDTISRILHNKPFEEKWNEFAYIFGTVVKNINDVQILLKEKEKETMKQRAVVQKNITFNEEYTSPTAAIKKKNDKLDISSFL